MNVILLVEVVCPLIICTLLCCERLGPINTSNPFIEGALDADDAGDEAEQPTRDPHTLALGFLLRLRRTGWLAEQAFLKK